MTRDPIGYSAHDANLYRYVGDSPLVYTDRNGTNRYITEWGGLNVHCGVAVDTWKCENGTWVKTGQKTFDFSVSSGWGVVPGILIWWGQVVESNGLNLTDPITITSNPCEDRKMLEWCEDQVEHPPFYSFLVRNCMFWAVQAVNVGMGAKCKCCPDGSTK